MGILASIIDFSKKKQKIDREMKMQKIFIVSSESSLEELNKLFKKNDDWFVSEISHPNTKGEWLVVLDDDQDNDDY